MSIATALPRRESLPLGIGLTLVAYAGFTMIDSSAKWLGAAGIPFFEIVFVRYFVHFLLINAATLPTVGISVVKSNNLRLELMRAGCLLASTLCNFLALQYLPLTVTAAIAFTVPLILCALSVPFLGETVGWRRWSAVLVGFLGVLVIVRPGTEAFHPAALASLAGAVATAFFFLLTRRLASVDSASTQQFYSSFVAVVCIAPFALSNWLWPAHPVDWLFFGLIGAVAVCGHQIFSIALRFAPAAILAPFAYFQIVYNALVSWLLFSQPPSVWVYIGAPIVIGSGLYIWLRERKLMKPVTPILGED